MLKVYSYGNLAFRGAAAPALAEPRVEIPQRPDRNPHVHRTDIPSSVRDELREGIFLYNNLAKNRPNMLAHTNVECYEFVQQFDTVEEKNLVLKMLQNFAFVDINNARKAFRQIHEELKGEIDIDKTKFATLGDAKSGDAMGYFYRQAAKIRSKGPVHHQYTDTTGITKKKDPFLSSTELSSPEKNKEFQKEGFENIVLIDDMIGDGDSLIEFFTPEIVESLKGYKNIYYVTIAKDPDGEKKVKETFPDLNIKFKSAYEAHKYDSPLNTSFTEKEKEDIAKLIDKYNQRIAPDLAEKFSRSKLLLAFEWNTPGNVPMMFCQDTDNWDALFERYNGLETDDKKGKEAVALNLFS